MNSTITKIVHMSVLLPLRLLRSLTTSAWPQWRNFSNARKNCKIMLSFVDRGHWGQFCMRKFWPFIWPSSCPKEQNFQTCVPKNTAKFHFKLQFTSRFQNSLRGPWEIRMRLFDNFRMFWPKCHQSKLKSQKKL